MTLETQVGWQEIGIFQQNQSGLPGSGNEFYLKTNIFITGVPRSLVRLRANLSVFRDFLSEFHPVFMDVPWLLQNALKSFNFFLL